MGSELTEDNAPDDLAVNMKRSMHIDGNIDSDDGGIQSVELPPVLRFDPVPTHAGMGVAMDDEETSVASIGGSEAFPFFDPPAAHSRPRKASLHTSKEQLELRDGWPRPSLTQDHILEEDDFVSTADLEAGKRRFAPPAPSPENQGKLLAEARKQYEREWATELEEIEHARTSIAEDKSEIDSQDIRDAKSEELHAVPTRTQPYITSGAHKKVLSGRSKHKTMGKTPARILKKPRTPDVAKVFGVKQRVGRKRNMGAGLEWKEAKAHWVRWLRRHKKIHYPRVPLVDPPDQEAVDEKYEELAARRRKRGVDDMEESVAPW